MTAPGSATLAATPPAAGIGAGEAGASGSPAPASAAGFMGFAADPDSRRAIAMAAAARGWSRPDVREGGVEAAHAALAGGAAPSFLVIDVSPERAPLPAVDRLADIAPQGLKVIALGNRNDVALFRGLRALGVADYLLKPVDPETLGRAIDTSFGEEGAPGSRREARRRAHVIAFLGSRGGAGTSALAASTAALLAADGRSVILVDFDLQMGTQALDLGGDGFAGLAALIETPDRFDPQVVEQALTPHPLGFRLLAGDTPLETPLSLEPDAALALIAAAGAGAEIVVVDLPRDLDRANRAVLRTADLVVLVTQPTLAGLRETGRLIVLVTALRAGAQPLVVVNRAGEAAAELSRGAFEGALRHRLACWLPADRRAAHAATVEATALSARAGPALRRGLRQLADIAGGTGARQRRAGLLARFRGR